MNSLKLIKDKSEKLCTSTLPNIYLGVADALWELKLPTEIFPYLIKSIIKDNGVRNTIRVERYKDIIVHYLLYNMKSDAEFSIVIKYNDKYVVIDIESEGS